MILSSYSTVASYGKVGGQSLDDEFRKVQISYLRMTQKLIDLPDQFIPEGDFVIDTLKVFQQFSAEDQNNGISYLRNPCIQLLPEAFMIKFQLDFCF